MADNGDLAGSDAKFVMLSALILGMLPAALTIDGSNEKA
jgi:hypothetical protein